MVRSSSRTRAHGRVLVTLTVAAMALVATACITELRSELGEDASVFAINDYGVMAGSVAGPAADVPTRFTPDGHRLTLPTLDDWQPVTVTDVNNAGEVVGVFDVAPGKSVPVAWDADGRPIDLPHLMPPGYLIGLGHLTNDGRIFANLWDETETPMRLVVINLRGAEPKVVLDTAEMPGGVPYVQGVNDAGDIAGLGDGWGRWTLHDGSYEFTPTPSFVSGDINNAGVIVGEHNVDGVWLPAVWNPADEAPTDLSTEGLPEGTTRERGIIDDAGTVIFNTTSGPVADRKPVRWKKADASTYTRPDVFPAKGWNQVQALDLSPKGAIAYAQRAADGTYVTVRWD